MADTRKRQLRVTERHEHHTDEGLVEAIARREPDALAEAYGKHGSRVLAIARGLCGEARAQEVTEEIFLQLWNDPQGFDPERGSLRGHLLMQAHGRAIDIVRSERADAEQPGSEDLAMRSIEGAEIDAQVAALPAVERHPIVLAYFGGHTYRDVARLLGVPEEVVKRRIRGGLERLRSEGATQPVVT